MDLGSLISLPTAAKRLGVSENDLRNMIEKGTIALGISPEGEIVVTQDNRAVDVNEGLRKIHRDQFVHLQDNRISATEAANKYGVRRHTILLWVRQGYIKVLRHGTGRGSRMTLDEADVAFCINIHHVRQQAGVHSGAPLLDEQGRPYLLKHPALSRYRREVKKGAP